MRGARALSAVRSTLKQVLPRFVLRRLRPQSTPTPGRVAFGDLRRTRPLSSHFGWERGQPVDRYYIERFLEARASDIAGRVLEVGDSSYTDCFGRDRVTRRDVLHLHEGSPGATVVADLSDAGHVPSEQYNCIVLTQTLHLIFDVAAAVGTLHRLLVPGGVLLLTVPGISPVDRGEWGASWCWSFTAHSARRSLELAFASADVEVEQYGNVLAAVSFLEGLASHELTHQELTIDDPAYPVIVAVRARKQAR